jgi:hypothetical protein
MGLFCSVRVDFLEIGITFFGPNASISKEFFGEPGARGGCGLQTQDEKECPT